MKIRKMTATFGKLKNETLELDPGLNIIEAPNESGKTTWCAFLNAMLYGIDTSERDKAGRLSVKTRYRPWDGGAMVGTVELVKDGKEITIQRTGRGTAPMKNFYAVYSHTADFIRDYDGDTAGEALTGVSRQVFERTAFIRRPDIRVNQTSELESKIAALVSTGDENTSYTRSDELLRLWQRRLRFNKSGSIPALEQQLREARAELEKIEASGETVADLRANIARQEKQIELMQEDLKVHEKLAQRNAAKELEKARVSADAADRHVAELTDFLTRDGRLMTREDTNAIREKAAAIGPLQKVAGEAERTLWRAEKALVDAANRREASPLNGFDEKAVAADLQRGRDLAERAQKAKEPRIPLVIPIVLWALAVAGLVLSTGLLAPLFKTAGALAALFSFNLIGIVASLLVGAAGLILFFVKPPKRRSAADELEELLAGYGVMSLDKLSSLHETYLALLREEELRRAERDAARQSYDAAREAAQEAGREAVDFVARFMPEVSSGEAVQEALTEAERALDDLSRARFDATSARNIYETLKAEYDDTVEVDDSYLPMPMRNREDTLAALERARASLTEATRAYDLATGAQRVQGDPAVIEGRIRALTERLEEENRRCNALELAVGALREANTAIQTRFSPEVSRRASQIMEKLTAGKYEKLTFDKGFDAGAKEAASPESRNVLALSDGTADEVYLSLRLAMCDLLLGGDDPCPIILDDALANFDDARCKAALDLLRDMSQTRQIILFTCHSREKRLLGLG